MKRRDATHERNAGCAWTDIRCHLPLDSVRKRCESGAHAVHDYPITQDLVALNFDGLYDLQRYAGTLQGWLMCIVAQRVSHADLLAEFSREIKGDTA